MRVLIGRGRFTEDAGRGMGQKHEGGCKEIGKILKGSVQSSTGIICIEARGTVQGTVR